MVIVVVMVFMVVLGYKWLCSGCGNACDSLFNSGSCDSCRSTIVVVVVVMLVEVVEVMV